MEKLAIYCIFLSFAALELFKTRLFQKSRQTRSDAIVEVVSTVTLLGFTQPMVLLAGGLLASFLLPNSAGALQDIPLLAAVALLLIFEDMMQYWWHRLSHTVPWLYKLHRPHHNAEYMSIRIVYRNNIFYYAMMPSLWFSGALIYLGLGWAYAGFLIVKQLVVIGAHSDVRWDAALYKKPWLSPIMWIVERTISTPATHAAHHGKFASDPATNYKGNYGNLLFFWDVLFGTAKITRSYPERFGVENLPETSSAEQLLWPLISTSAPITAEHNNAESRS